MVEEDTHCPICLRAVDQFGDHQVGCGGNGDRIHRHDFVRDALFSAAQIAALAPPKKVPLIPGTRSRQSDIFLPIWQTGQATFDVTMISTLQQFTVGGAAIKQGYICVGGWGERKRVAHATACRAVGVNFISLVMECLGGWSEEAAATIYKIGRLLEQRLGLPTSETTRYLFKSCAISLCKGNANLWIRCLPFHSPFVDGSL